ncbi:MAG: acyl-CoA thioesterase [Methylobacteriaceae bacterium]|nr:acyl-CoA thioesterase [Methylobacteriaceae bacterium]
MPDLDLAALEADPKVIWTEDVLRFGDTDLNGHVNNAVFATMAESGRVNLFRKTFGIWASAQRDTYFVIVKLAIEFRSELHYPGRVRTGTWVTRLGRSSIGLAQAICGDRQVAATAEAVCVLMSAAERRPTPFPPDMREAAEELLRPEPG